MSFLRRLLGNGQSSTTRPSVQIVLQTQSPEADEELAVVTLGGVPIPAVVYRDYERDDDWTSGIRLEHPVNGRWLLADDEYPDSIRAAGDERRQSSGCPTTRMPSGSSSDLARSYASYQSRRTR